ncbi:MAG: hypothetical protein IJH83_09035 [Coriobacteriales bacterium]|nr:hypothetical protein [Coriobacteriales bacterium]
MSQRNPMNDRYKGDGPSGSTKKSTSNAKPKQKAASTIYTPAPMSKEDKRKAQRAKEKEQRREMEKVMAAAGDPLNAEYQKYRRLWWAGLIGAIVFTALSWGMRVWFPDAVVPSVIFLLLAYAAIIAAFVLDLKKVRPMRLEHQNRVMSMSKKEKERLVQEAEKKQLDAIEAKKAEKAAKAAKKEDK